MYLIQYVRKSATQIFGLEITPALFGDSPKIHPIWEVEASSSIPTFIKILSFSKKNLLKCVAGDNPDSEQGGLGRPLPHLQVQHTTKK